MPAALCDDVIPAWEQFRSRLRIYGKALDSLDGPATAQQLLQAEADVGFALPSSLRDLLSLSNGQASGTPGLFKSLSGWDRYLRHLFLGAAGIADAYRALVADEPCRRLLGEEEIPFAVHGHASSGYVCSVHRGTGAVSLLKTVAHDWTLPDDWQIERKAWAPSLAAFLLDQVALYR
jgi:hypothetical protein